MFITANQILCHLVGDYVLQSHWMANEKTKNSFAALAHALAYSIGFLFLDLSLIQWLAIVVPHFFIDRFRLARYLVFLKNFLAPKSTWKPWKECSATGYHESVPAWLSVWLMIAADNVIHLVTNALALYFL